MLAGRGGLGFCVGCPGAQTGAAGAAFAGGVEVTGGDALDGAAEVTGGAYRSGGVEVTGGAYRSGGAELAGVPGRAADAPGSPELAGGHTTAGVAGWSSLVDG